MKKIFLLTVFFLFSTIPVKAQISPGSNNHSFQYLTGVLTPASPVSGVAPAWNAFAPPKHYTMAVTTTDSGFQVVLEGSLDNQNWSNIAITNSAIGMVSNQNFIPALYFRMRASQIGANTSVTGTAIGVW